MRIIFSLCALLLFASVAQCQTSSKLPCDFSGNLLTTREGNIVRFNSDEMKERATRKVDLDSPLIKQLDFRSVMVVEVLVGKSGEVVCMKTISGISLARKSVEAALKEWKFKPEKLDGKPVAYLGQLNFVLCNLDCGKEAFGVTLLK
jgi:hypothetical protein